MCLPVADCDEGVEMFARYAYAPNHLGYCGPPELAALRDASVDEVRIAARSFSGAWPYLEVLSGLTGIADPLDLRLVESYWLGGVSRPTWIPVLSRVSCSTSSGGWPAGTGRI